MLIEKLDRIRTDGATFGEGLSEAIKFTEHHNGSVFRYEEDGAEFVDLCVGCDRATVFQPFPDIDKFYFEA